MKVFVLAIAVFVVNGYVTKATSLDPLENVEIDAPNTDSEDARTKRSGDIFSSLVKKKLGLFSSLTGSSSGKSLGQQEHFEEPLSYHTKSFNLWGVKKAIMSSVLQAAKAITGGVIALKGHLITAKGHMVVAKGKLMQTKGQAISNFGKSIATHAFDTNHESPQYDEGLYNHLPVVPAHQPTSYGAATAFGYQQQVYPNTAHASHAYPTANGYQVAAANNYPPTGFAAPQSGYNGGGQEYPGYGGGNSFTAKRAVSNAAQQTTFNQMKNDLDKDSVRAGLLIFKPIKMPQNLPQGVNSALQSTNIHSAISQYPSQSGGVFPTENFKANQNFEFKNPFSGFQAAQANGGYQAALANRYQTPLGNGYHTAPANGYQTPLSDGYKGALANGYQASSANGYQTPLSNGFGAAPNGGLQIPATAEGFSSLQGQGYPAQSNYKFPSTGSGGSSSAIGVERVPEVAHAHQTYDFPQPANSQEFNRQLADFAGQQAFDNFGGDQHDAASSSEHRVAQPAYKHARLAEAQEPKARRTEPEPAVVARDFFLPTTTKYDDVVDNQRSGYAKKRSAPKHPEPSSASVEASSSSSSQESIVPLKYHDNTSVEDQARLKQTVQRFFSMLQKQP